MKKTLIATIFVAVFAFGSVTVSTAGQHKIYSKTYACLTNGYMDKLSRLGGDQTAFGQALAAGVLSGNCTLFMGGETVYITDHSWGSGTTKIHEAGNPVEYWVPSEKVN